jgi:hypothetical protein
LTGLRIPELGYFSYPDAVGSQQDEGQLKFCAPGFISEIFIFEF